IRPHVGDLGHDAISPPRGGPRSSARSARFAPHVGDLGQNATEGGITLGAKNLYELIANAPGDEVTLKKADNHWAEIKSGKVTYRIVGMPDRDFPKVPDHREASYTTLESAVLREMIERTLFSVCNDETRFHLNGVFFESDGSKSRMVSTDGHRLSKVERTIANGPKLSAGVIIPKKGLLEIKKVLERVGRTRGWGEPEGGENPRVGRTRGWGEPEGGENPRVGRTRGWGEPEGWRTRGLGEPEGWENPRLGEPEGWENPRVGRTRGLGEPEGWENPR